MVGIKDVAGKAGVSISTVSYVMSGKRPISPATRRRVLAAARTLRLVAGEMGRFPDITYETVLIDTPALPATSLIPTMSCVPILP